MKTKEQEIPEVKQGAGTYDFSAMLNGDQQEEEKEVSFEGFEGQEKEEEDSKGEEKDTPEDPKLKKEPEDEGQKEGEEPKDKPEPRKQGDPTYESKVAKRYIEEGIWDDYVVDYKGEEVKISEIEDLDEDTFFEIIKAQKEETEKNLSTNYIDKSELDEISLDVIEISKNGGDISNVLKIKEEFINPLETYDLNDESHQEGLVRQMYSMENRALTSKQIDNLIKIDKEELELESKAVSFADKLKESYKETLRKEKEATYAKKKEKEEQTKNLKKGLKEEFKILGYDKASFISPLINKATSEEEFSQEIESLKQDPKMLAEFLIWKTNPEEYRKNIASKEVKKEQVGTARKLNLLRKESGSSKTSSSKTPEKKNKIEDEFIQRLQ